MYLSRTLLRFTTDSVNIAFTTHLISNHSHIHYASPVNKTIEVYIHSALKVSYPFRKAKHNKPRSQIVNLQTRFSLLTFRQGQDYWPAGKVKKNITLFNFNVWICCFSVVLEGWMGGQHVLLVQPILTRDPALPLPA